MFVPKELPLEATLECGSVVCNITARPSRDGTVGLTCLPQVQGFIRMKLIIT